MFVRSLAIVFTIGLTFLAYEPGMAQTKPDSSACRIKGNISTKTGEKIYHVPGQRWYSRTKISPNKGERWFCTEKDARKAGWRKAKV